MMTTQIPFDKRTTVVVAGAVLAAAMFLVFIRPIYAKAKSIAQEVKALNHELRDVRGALERSSRLNQKKHLLTRNEVSRAINEITNLGTALHINFLSTSPQRIEKQEGSKYPVLPIHFEVQSTYSDLGIFLGALEKSTTSVVTVHEFSIDRRQEILPEIYTELVVYLYLREGQDG